MNRLAPSESQGRADRLAPLRPVRPGGLGQAVASTLDSMCPPLLTERLTDHLSSSSQRLALYNALLSKAVAAGDSSQIDLESMIRDERQHAAVIRRYLTLLGIDPAFSPSQRGTEATHRILQIIVDPRTTISQSLCALLGAVLAAVGEWESISRLAREACEQAMAADFDNIRSKTESHVHRIRIRADQVIPA